MRRRVALAGAVLLAITVLTAVLAPVLAPWDPLALDVKGRLGRPAGATGSARTTWGGTC